MFNLDDFISLFSGNKNSFGFSSPKEDTQKADKRQPVYQTKKQVINASYYTAHLCGSYRIGICPLNEQNMVTFAVIDIDDYNTARTKTLRKIIVQNNLPLCPFESKSGGLHLYCFFSRPLSAVRAIKFMQYWVQFLALPAKTEIFPKQTKLNDNTTGSWINIPYFAASSDITLLDANVEVGKGQTGLWKGDSDLFYSLEEAVEICKSKRVDTSELDSVIENTPLFDAPPCLQHLYVHGCDEQRNIYLFNLAVYAKAKYDEDYKNFILEANNLLSDPLSEDEIEKTVFQSIDKLTYSYQCGKNSLLSNFCNKAVCKTRAYTAGGFVPSMEFGEMTQITSNPPQYKWEVNGTTLTFTNEVDIIKQQAFRVLCMRNLGILPPMVKDGLWTEIVNKALANRKKQKPANQVGSVDCLLREVDKLLDSIVLSVTPVEYVDKSLRRTLVVITEINGFYFYCFDAVSLREYLKESLADVVFALDSIGCELHRDIGRTVYTLEIKDDKVIELLKQAQTDKDNWSTFRNEQNVFLSAVENQ